MAAGAHPARPLDGRSAALPGAARPAARRCWRPGAAARPTAGEPVALSPEQRGLRDLHLGLDRPAQGGGGAAPRAGQPPALPAGRSAMCPGERVPAQDLAQLRRLGGGAVRAARLAGAAVVLAPPGEERDLPALVRRMARRRRSPRCPSPPRRCRCCCRSRSSPAAGALRTVLAGGEAMPAGPAGAPRRAASAPSSTTATARPRPRSR